MKQKLGILLVLIAFGALLTISLIHDSKANAAHSPENAIKTAVLTYLNSVNTGDIDTLIQHTYDLSIPDKSMQQESYKDLKVSITNISIKSIEPITPTSYKVNIAATINGNKEEIALPVVNKYDLLLVVTGQQQQQQ
ncbi:MAG: hypothetical protein WD469_10545 [Paenibacillaceae bacterium]